jgi:type I restriction enzyme S subunit
LRFPEFSGEWKRVELKDVAEFQKSRIPADSLDASCYISTENLIPNFGGIKEASSISTDGNVMAIKPNDILISNIRPYLKKVWQSDRFGGCSADVFVLRTTGCQSDFLYNIIASDKFINYAMSGAKGVKMPRGDKRQMEEFEFSIPAIEEQNRISRLLSLLDERIATQNKIIEDLKKLKSAIIEKHYSQAEKQIVCVTDLGEPFNVGNLAKDDLAETGMPCVIYGELFTTYGEIISQIESHTNKTEGMILSKKGDLLFPSSTTVDAMSLIAPSVINVDGVILGGDMFGIHISTNFNAQYLSYYFNHIAKRQLAKFAKGSTIIHLHYTDIEKAKLFLPSLEEQNRMAKCLLALDAKMNIENIYLSLLNGQKTYLLCQMFI